MNGLSLYNIKNKAFELIEKAEEGELTPKEIEEQSKELVELIKNKADGIVAYTRNMDGRIEMLDNEIERLSAIKKMIINKKDKLYEYVKKNMEELGFDKIETPIGNIVIAKNPMSIEIENEDLVPDKYKKEKIVVLIDKMEIKKDYKETGEIIAGVNVIENKTHLKIG